MDYAEQLNKVKALLKESRYYDGLLNFFVWDQWQGLPAQGQAYRQQMQGYFSGKAAELYLRDEARRLAQYFAAFDPARLESDLERAIVRVYLRHYNQAARIPVEKQVELAELTAQAGQVWRAAFEKSDYNLFRPYLERVFRLRIEMAGLQDANRHPLDVMADGADEGIDTAQVQRLFAQLKAGLRTLLRRIQSAGVEIDNSCLAGPFKKEDLRALAVYLVEATGYDATRGGYGEVIHPFTAMLGPADARITTNYGTFAFAIFAALHEAGHAMYGYRSSPEVAEAGLWGGNHGGFHEAQSRFYENLVGKSRPFWEFFYPELQKRLPAFQAVDLDGFYRAINKVQPSFKRVLADELTYSLHPIIRFEIEKDIIEGKVTFDALPAVWNDKYEEALGIRPPDDRAGVLQDVHWSMGLVGYFQSYALGNLYGGQLRQAMLRAEPDVYAEIGRGNFGPLNRWLTENVHQHGAMYAPAEMIRRAAGEDLKADYFLAYLAEKYRDIYHLG